MNAFEAVIPGNANVQSECLLQVQMAFRCDTRQSQIACLNCLSIRVMLAAEDRPAKRYRGLSLDDGLVVTGSTV